MFDFFSLSYSLYIISLRYTVYPSYTTRYISGQKWITLRVIIYLFTYFYPLVLFLDFKKANNHFQIDKLMNDVLTHVNDMLTRGAESTMDQVFDAKYKQKLYPVVKLITQYATEGID